MDKGPTSTYLTQQNEVLGTETIEWLLKDGELRYGQ